MRKFWKCLLFHPYSALKCTLNLTTHALLASLSWSIGNIHYKKNPVSSFFKTKVFIKKVYLVTKKKRQLFFWTFFSCLPPPWLLISLSIWSVHPFLTEGTFSPLSLSLWSFGEVAVTICFVLQLCVAESFHWRSKLRAGLLATLTLDSTFLAWAHTTQFSLCKGNPQEP